VNGQLTDTRTRSALCICCLDYPLFICVIYRFLGTRPIRLVRVQIQRNPAILALSSRSWVNYTHQNLMHFTPLIFENFDYAWSFSAELSPEGLIGIAGSTLR
jgi:splicing factor 3B subunit 3